ncbi:hypothetical protein V6N13_128961 [Hibiscus sabdariffa]
MSQVKDKYNSRLEIFALTTDKGPNDGSWERKKLWVFTLGKSNATAAVTAAGTKPRLACNNSCIAFAAGAPELELKVHTVSNPLQFLLPSASSDSNSSHEILISFMCFSSLFNLCHETSQTLREAEGTHERNQGRAPQPLWVSSSSEVNTIAFITLWWRGFGFRGK